MESMSPAPRLSPFAAGVLTFLAAAGVLVLEIAAVRLLAPFVGLTLTTYTGIIGVILAGIALGAWAGGRLADAYPGGELIGAALGIGGAAAIASVPIVAAVGAADIGGFGDVAEVLVLATLGFVVPAAILSSIAPMIVRASMAEVRTSGSLVGRLSAIGTLGAISGTFLTGFVLLGLFPTRWLIAGVGGLFIVLGLVVAVRGRRAGPAGIASSLVVGLVLGGSAVQSPTPCDHESRYYCFRIEVVAGDASQRTLVLDGLSHAFVDVDDPEHLRFGYIRRFAEVVDTVAETRGGRFDVLHVGGGGFTFPRYLVSAYPDSRHTVLELDPRMLETASRELGFVPDDRIRVTLGDGRLSILGQPPDSADVVVGDAFGGLAVPWHLTTLEFLAEIDRVLRDRGVYVMNLIDDPPFGFVRAEAATAREVFGNVAIIGRRPLGGPASGGNVVIVASRVPIDVAAIRERLDAGADGPLTDVLADGPGLDAFIGSSSILSDDYAPVDQLLGR
jgi:spermidine synthase